MTICFKGTYFSGIPQVTYVPEGTVRERGEGNACRFVSGRNGLQRNYMKLRMSRTGYVGSSKPGQETVEGRR
jgi:hypothetical protein